MRVLLFGATGVVGRGALEECLLDPGVESVLSIVRAPAGKQHEKLRELVHTDFFDFSPIQSQLAGFDACFFCLGISSVEMNEENYRWVTYDVTMTVAQTLAKLNPAMTFIYVLSMRARGEERHLWARVKDETERMLRALPVQAYMLHPARVLPNHGAGIRGELHEIHEINGPMGFLSRKALSLLLLAAIAPLFPWLKAWFPRQVTTTGQVGLAMLKIARQGAPQRILENSEINTLPVAS